MFHIPITAMKKCFKAVYGMTIGNWILQYRMNYAAESKSKLVLSVILSIISITSGLIPFYCFYRVICLFINGTVTGKRISFWSMWALAAIDWRLFLASLITFPLSFICMRLTFKISGKN